MLFKKLITQLCLLASPVLCFNQELPNDANTSLLLHFNSSLTGASGEAPTLSNAISYEAGKFGMALKVAPTTRLHFDTTQNMNTKQGTIEFWIKPNSGLGGSSLFDMRTTNGMFIEIGNWTSIYINTLPSNPNPQVNISYGGGTAYYPNTWYHLAFSWGGGVLSMYLNGKLLKTLAYNFDLFPVPLTYFSIGSDINGSNQCLGLIDECRISKSPRSALEICQSYLNGQNLGALTNLAVRNNNTITLFKTWNLYLHKSDFWKVPSIYTLNGTDTVNLPNSCINWSVSNTTVADVTNGVLTAKSAGNSFLIGSSGGQNVTIPITVLEPVKQIEYETSIDPFLTTPASCNLITVHVVAIIYLPSLDGVNINTAETAPLPIPQQTLVEAKKHVVRINLHTKFSLEEGSRYRGYNDIDNNSISDSVAYLGYKIIDYIYVYEPVPRGFPSPGSPNVFFSDYDQIIKRFNGQNYVDNLGVKEFWIYGYHTGEIVPAESNMSSPTTGDISNSYRFPDDMPVYSKTYITYNYNYTRVGNQATHNHGHQIESMVDYVAIKQDGNVDLFRSKFRGYPGSGPGGPIGRCGDTHHPPNSTSDYDYNNSTLVASDIKDWKPAGGVTTLVNNNTWGSINYKWPPSLIPSMPPNVESNWYVFWMQSMPGNGNKIPHGTRWMTNWWRFLGNWDSTTVKIGLHQANPESNLTSCFPTATTELSNNEQIKIYPNPVYDKLIITRSVTTNSTISIRLFDMTGREMKRTKSSSLQTEIDMSRIPSGNYVLWIEDKANRINGRKMITKQ